MAMNGLTFDGETYRWVTTFNDLKNFVEELLGIKGKWTSPRGDAKLFQSEGEAEFVLKWYGPRSKRLAIQADSSDNYLKRKLEGVLNHDVSSKVTSDEAAGLTLHSSESEVCSCVSNSFITQLASLKADITGLESRFNSELVSEIGLLRSKQKDLIAVIHQQDQAICKLNDKNLSLISKLQSLEKLISKVADNAFVNNGHIINDETSMHNDPTTTVNVQSTVPDKNTPSASGTVIPNEICILDDSTASVKDQSCVLYYNDRRSNIDCRFKSTIEEIDNNASKSNKLNRSQVSSHFRSDNTVNKPDLPKSYRPNMVYLPNHPINTPKYSYRQNGINNGINRSQSTFKPKHQVPCPFLGRRGFC